MPFIVFLVFAGYEKTFIGLFIFNQITDFLDGFIARKFNMITVEGAILDSWADLGSYIIAVCGIIKYHTEILEPHYFPWILAYIVVYCITILTSLLRYGKVVSGLHLYSSKIVGYILGFFFVVLFLFKFIPAFYYFSMTFGIFSEIECIAITLISKEQVINAKGLYWFLKSRKIIK